MRMLKRGIFFWMCLIVLLLTQAMYGECFAQSSSACPDEDSGKEKREHNNSLLQYENWIAKQSFIPWDDCFSSGKIIWNASELNQTFIPSVITQKGYKIPRGKQADAIASAIISWGAAGIASAFTGGIGGLIFAGIQMLIMMDACTNSYVLAPHEYFNKYPPDGTNRSGGGCEKVTPISGDGAPSANPERDCARVRWKNADALTAEDIPFFYHCDPMWDPISGKTLNANSAEDAKLIGRTYGYMGSASQYCIGDMGKYGAAAKSKNLVGKVAAQSAGGLIFRWMNNFGICDDYKRGAPKIIGPGDETYVYPVFTYAYYKYFSETGKIKICTSSIRTLFPVRLGCTTIAPPGDEDPVDPLLRAYVQGTRCLYLISPRDDLHALGNLLSDTDQDGAVRISVKKFLKSEFHFTSTVVGCIKDMLVRIFVSKPADTWGTKPFFQKVQERLKQIILAVLVLYVTLVGVKIMTSPEPPKRPEVIMIVLKFALVFYFALGNAFYESGPNGEVKGLYPQLLSVTDELANMFMQAQNSGDYLGMCTYKYNNKNLLGESIYQGGGTVTTEGSPKGTVKLTLWDLLDCKLINYLNAGSCDYTAGGLVLAWLGSVAFFVSGIGVLLALVSFIYCFMILLVIFRYTHIYILAIVIVTILLFLAPIFVCFALFEATKGIFDKWMKVILGYLLYPALLFAFLAIMLATFDSIYYGDLKINENNPSQGPVERGLNVKTACNGVNSIYCMMMKPLIEKNIITSSNDACTLTYNAVARNNLGKKSMSYVGDFVTLKPDVAQEIFVPMLKLMLFAFLFYLFMGTVSAFMAAILGVFGLQDISKGGLNLANMAGAAGGGAASAAASGISALAGGGDDKKDDKKER